MSAAYRAAHPLEESVLLSTASSIRMREIESRVSPAPSAISRASGMFLSVERL
jgi:hypothetical protein